MSSIDWDPYDDPVCDACGGEATECYETVQRGRLWLCWSCCAARREADYYAASADVCYEALCHEACAEVGA